MQSLYRFSKRCQAHTLVPCYDIRTMVYYVWEIIHKYKRSVNIMSETMKDYEAEINASFRRIGVGDIVTGTVIAVSEDEITLDLRYYASGIIKAEDYSDDPDCMLK